MGDKPEPAVWLAAFIPASVSVLLAAVIAFPCVSEASLIPAAPHLSVKGGVNSSRIDNEFFKLERRTGFEIAFAAEWSLGWLSFAPELEYAQRGYSLEVTETDYAGDVIQTVEAVTRLDVISLPLLLQARFARDSRLAPFVVAGPSPSLIVNKEPGELRFTDRTVPDDYSDHFRDASLDLTMGGGVHLLRKYILEVRYNLGLTDIMKEGIQYEAKGRSLDILFGLRLR